MSLTVNTRVTIIYDLLGQQVCLNQLFHIVVPFAQDSLFTIIITITLPLPFLCLVSFTKPGKTIQSARSKEVLSSEKYVVFTGKQVSALKFGGATTMFISKPYLLLFLYVPECLK